MKPSLDDENTYKDVDKDIDRYLEKYGKWDYSGPTPIVYGYSEAKDLIYRQYLEKRHYDPLITYVIGFHHEAGYCQEVIEPLQKVLIAEGDERRLSRLWKAVIAQQKLCFWQLHSLSTKLHLRSLPEKKALVLESMERYCGILEQLGYAEAAGKIRDDMAYVEREERRMLTSKPDPRTVSEQIFWDLVQQAKAPANSTAEQVEQLVDLLAQFKGSEIKRFKKILDQKMSDCYTWEIWALAFLAQDGCSDDEFENFRAWLILQGKETFEDAVQEIDSVLDRVPSGPKTGALDLLYVSEQAYELRTGKPLVSKVAKVKEPKGKRWDEHELSLRFPKAFAHYRDIDAG